MPLAFVIMGSSSPRGHDLNAARFALQASAALDLEFLVNTEHQRLGRGRGKSLHDIRDLLSKIGPFEDLEPLRDIAHQARFAHMRPDAGRRDAQWLRPNSAARRASSAWHWGGFPAPSCDDPLALVSMRQVAAP